MVSVGASDGGKALVWVEAWVLLLVWNDLLENNTDITLYLHITMATKTKPRRIYK